MSIAEIRALSDEQIINEIDLARKALFEARMKKALHQLTNTAELGQLKRRVAQLKTVLQENANK